jgi:acyl dehydratase
MAASRRLGPAASRFVQTIILPRLPVVDRKFIGYNFPPHSADVEAGRLRLFAKAIGETRPEYVDAEVARAAGHPGLPAPPTFAMCLEFETPDPYRWLALLGIDLAMILHGGQSFRYLAPIYAGDRLTFASRIEDIYGKKSGTLTFVVKETDVTNQHGARVAELRSTVVIRAQ